MNNLQPKLIAIVCSGAMLTGCAMTPENQQRTAAVLGGLAGGLATGLATGNVGYGIAGAAAGAALAWGAVKLVQYNSQQTRTEQQDQQMYGYTAPSNSTEVKIRNATAYPERVRAGDTLKISMDYSVMAPQGTQSVNVQEVMVLKRDGKVLQTLSERPVTRPLGGGSSQVDFTIPDKMPPGTYVIEQKIQAGTSYDVRPAVFVVGS